MPGGPGEPTDPGEPEVFPPSPAEPGTWVNVTPSNIDLAPGSFNGDNFGVSDVLVDPVRPQDLYAFVNHQGLWKSTDHGLTWSGPINTGTGGALLTSGKPWTAAIERDAGRDPSTPPRLWSAAGNNAMGVLRSDDGGVSWVAFPTGNTTAIAAGGGSTYWGEDLYSLDVDPYDSDHLIAGFHGYPGVSETFDAGNTWSTVPVPSGIGGSLYPFFIDTGSASTMRNNWITIAQADGAGHGTWHTSDAGAHWARVGGFEHFHGNSQVHNAGNGVAYIGAEGGVFKTTTGGASWTPISTTHANGVVATPSTLYATFGWASSGGWDPHFQRAARSTETTWSAAATPGMSNGWKRASVTHDGTHHVIVSGNWNAGIWRYVE